MNKQLIAGLVSLFTLAGVAVHQLNSSNKNNIFEETGLIQVAGSIDGESDCPVSPILRVPVGYQPIHVSGLDGVDEKCKDFEKEVGRLFAKLDQLLASVGVCKESLYHVQVIVNCPHKLKTFYELYAKYVGKQKPTRNTFLAKVLPNDAQVKLSAVAYAKPAQSF